MQHARPKYDGQPKTAAYKSPINEGQRVDAEQDRLSSEGFKLIAGKEAKRVDENRKNERPTGRKH